jgi:hypothetical protein
LFQVGEDEFCVELIPFSGGKFENKNRRQREQRRIILYAEIL